MKKHTSIILYPILSLVLFGASGPAYSWVKDISLERVFVGENTRVHEVAVKCRIEQKARVLRKVVSSSGSWCAADLPDLCSEQKVSAARKLCSYGASEFRELVKSGATEAKKVDVVKKPKQTAYEKALVSKAELLQEQMLIEERRIKIEQRRIELSRKEVALKKMLTLMIETASLDAS